MTRPVFPSVTDELPILLRAFVESAKKDPRKRRRSPHGPIQSASEWTLAFDTETTIDPGQALRVGFCRVYYRDELRWHGLFYDANVLTSSELQLARRYAESKQIEFMSRDEFIDKVFYKYGYHLRAMIVGFNLPFDLSRLAISHSPARGTMRGGFSLKLSPFKPMPASTN